MERAKTATQIRHAEFLEHAMSARALADLAIAEIDAVLNDPDMLVAKYPQQSQSPPAVSRPEASFTSAPSVG